MVMRRIMYQFLADGSQFSGETKRMANDADTAFSRAGAAAAGIAAGLGSALAIMDQLVVKAHELDLGAIERLIAAGLTGGDTATGEAWLLTQSLVGGVGPEQAFDTAEALSDAFRMKPDVANTVAAGIGLDRSAFLGLSAPAERANMIMDVLVARGGVVDDAVLAAASDLGAGDIRDMSAMAGIISQVPEFHPRAIADRIRPAMPTLDEERQSARDALDWEVTQRIADAELSTQPWWSMHHYLRDLPFVGRWHTEQIAEGALRSGTVVVEPSLAGQVRVSQRNADNAADGRISDEQAHRQPDR